MPIHTEISADDLFCGLELPIDATVTLFQPGGVPRQVQMNKVGAIGLEVDAFSGGIGADQDTQRLRVRIGVKGAFYLFAAI